MMKKTNTRTSFQTQFYLVITNTSAEPPNNCEQGVKKYEVQDKNGHHADLHCMPNGQMFKRLYSTHSSHNNQHKMSFRNKCEEKKSLRHRNANQTTTTTTKKQKTKLMSQPINVI